MLTVSLLVCAIMALTSAAGPPAAPVADPGEKTEPFVQESHIVRRSASCPSSWTRYNGRCFLYVPTPMNWANAERNCQIRGGNLASVHSLNEHHVIQSMIHKITHTYPLTWLGGSDAQQERHWFWSDGTPFVFKYWAPGQPDNFMKAHCLAMNYGDHKKFDDQTCKNLRPFVCAKKL